MPQPKENSPIKRDILFRVHLLYAAFVLIAALVFARLIWVQLFSSEVAYNADRLAGRILGQGDVVSLVEKAMETVDREEAEKMAGKMMKGKFDLEDMLSQLKQVQKLGSLGSILGMIPGLSKIKNQIEAAGVGDNLIKKQEAIILSMTKQERRNPDVIKASRKKRIAAGAGVEVHEVNKLLKSYEQMSTMMKKMGKMGGLKGMPGSALLNKSPFGNMLGGKGGKFPF